MGWTVLLLSPLRQGTGNSSTIQRIRTYLEEEGTYTSILLDPEGPGEDELKKIISERDIKTVIAIHAYKSGRLLTDCSIPVILILGGTDVNQFCQEKDILKTMARAVCNSSKVIAFSEAMADRARALWPDLGDDNDKLVVIKQAVITNPSNFSLLSYLRTHEYVQSVDCARVFLILGAIRPVKNPLYLVKHFSEWHKTRPDVLLVIVGPKYGEDYHKEFLQEISSLPGIIYIPGIPLEDAHAAIQESFALVNTSESEGMPAVLLEAMQLGTPVVARGIEGNKTLIEDGVTGFIFDAPEEFLDKACSLLENKDLRGSIISKASSYVRDHHASEMEKQLYLKALNDVSMKCNSLKTSS